jgi:hypothetical protein
MPVSYLLVAVVGAEIGDASVVTIGPRAAGCEPSFEGCPPLTQRIAGGMAEPAGVHAATLYQVEGALKLRLEPIEDCRITNRNDSEWRLADAGGR